MKLRGIELVLIAVSIASISSTPISRSQRKIVQNVIGTCLQIAPDLKPCNFDAEATWRSTSGEIPHGSTAASGYPRGKFEQVVHGHKQNQQDGVVVQKEQEELQNDLDFTVVYYLEGCLPSRLPFDLPSCPIEELQAIQMNKLVPFKLPDLEDALIFPEIDFKEIGSRRQSRASSSHEDPESRSAEKAPSGLQDFHNTKPNRRMKPRTGMASTKFVNMLPAAGPRPMDAPSGSKKWDESTLGGISDSGIREVDDIFAKYKNRVQ